MGCSLLGCGWAQEVGPAGASGGEASGPDIRDTDDSDTDGGAGDGDSGGTTGDPGTTGTPADPDDCEGPTAEPTPGPQPGPSIDYSGIQYNYGGQIQSIDGTVPEVDTIANDIMTSAAATVDEIDALRELLPYGEIDVDPCAPEQLTLYPPPPGIEPSDQYAVTVEQREAASDSFVYQIQARKPDTNRELDTSWTSFSFHGPVTVHVEKLAGDPATGCIVRPFEAQIETEFEDGMCTFSLDEPANVSVEFLPNIHNPVLHPMLVFANPPEVDVPSPDDPKVRWFGPGVHEIGAEQPIESGATIYIAGGAWVQGAFVASGPVDNVTIKGRGVISGLFLDTGNQDLNKDQPGLIDVPYRDSDNLLVEGITLVDAPRFNVRALAQHTTIENVKVMSWWFSTDGLVGGHKSLIENSFIKVNDDSIKLHWGDTIVRSNVLWQLENGGTFNLSWNINDDVRTFHVYDNDVIHAEHYEFEAQAVFRSRHAGSGTLGRYLFDDIRIENANWRLFYLVLENNKWYDPALGHGEIEQVIFRNIHAYSEAHQRPNVIRGIDNTHKVRNVAFQNVFTDGRCLASAQDGDFDIEPMTSNAIRIVKSASGDCYTP